MARPEKRQKLEDESIDSDELSSTNFSDLEEEPEKVVISAEAKRLLMAQEYMEKMGVKYDGSNDLENVAQALGIETGGEQEIRSIAVADEIEFSLVKLLPAKNHRATCVEISFDDKYAYTGGKDGRIVIWNLTTMERERHLQNPNPSSSITHICLAMAGKLLISCSTDRCLRIWNTSSYELVHTFPEIKGTLNAVCALGDSIFTVSDDKALRQYSLLTKSCLKVFYGHGARVTFVDALSQDHVLTTGDDKTARFWSLRYEKHSQYNGLADMDSCSVLNKHGFVSGDNRGVISLWSIARKKALKTATAKAEAAGEGGRDNAAAAPVSALALIPNTDACFSGTEGGLIQCWKTSMASGGILQVKGKPIKTDGIINGMKVSRSGRFLVAATATESRLGRWSTRKTKDVGLLLIELKHSRISKLYNDGDLIK